MNEPLLRVEALVKHFPVGGWPRGRHVHAVDDVSFAIRRGETLGLVGESGSGKSTVARCVLRLIEPTKGQVLFDGKDILKLRGRDLLKLRRRMQMVFQDPAGSLNPRFTVWQLLSEPFRRFKIVPRDEVRQAVVQLLVSTGLQVGDLEKYPHHFSGGQQQRIAVARAIASKPDLIVLDEPTSSLDVSIRMQVIELFQELQQQYQLGYLFISHDLSVIRHICDRVAVMYLGQLVEVAPAVDLFQNPLHPYTRALIAAIPRVDPAARKERVLVRGEIPSAIAPPKGCRFHTRCPLAIARCREHPPPLQPGGTGRQVRCHLLDLQEMRVA